MSQERPEEAANALLHSLTLWSPEQPDDLNVPSYASRLALVRLLMEVDLDQNALAVLDGLQKEDDECVDTWYLFGFAYYRLGERCEKREEEDLQELSPEQRQILWWQDAKECLQQAEQVLYFSDVKVWHQFECDDNGILEHVREMLSSLVLLPQPQEEDEAWESDDDDAMET